MKYFYLVYAIPNADKTVFFDIMRINENDRTCSCLRNISGAVKVCIFKSKRNADSDAEWRNKHESGKRYYRHYFG